MDPKPLDILFVDDDREILDLVGNYLKGHGHRIQLTDDGLKALELVSAGHFDMVFTDYKMPGIDGIQLLSEIKKQKPETVVVLVTGYGTLDAAIKAMRFGSYDFLQKPFKMETLRLLVEKVAEEKKASRIGDLPKKRIRPKYRLGNLWGVSASMREIISIIDKMDNNHTNVLISGESGTGKKRAAKAVHEKCRTGNQSMVTISGTELQKVFGKKGNKSVLSGVLEDENGATLYIDRIFGVPAKERSHLMDWISEAMTPVRIIAASEIKIEEALAEGRVEKNFLDRLNPIPIHMPPLRERQEDIPLLIHQLLFRFHAGGKGPVVCLEPEVMEILLAYHWPGNIIQLENVIERAVALCTGSVIDMDLMPDDIKNFQNLM